jgi:hypothetical protein
MSFKNPLTPAITSPIGIDRPIQTLQAELADIDWLEKCFGRAYDSRKKDVNGKELVYPEVWQGEGLDLLSVLPNDNLKAHAFFSVEDPIKCLEYSPDDYNLMQAVVNIILWFNLDAIKKDLDYRYTEVLKSEVQRVITTATLEVGDSVRILNVYDRPENVFKKYSLNLVRDQELIHPYGGFRFECELTYQEYCGS